MRTGCRDRGGYAASIVSLLNIRFSQDTAIRCMQGYDAAITFEVVPVFTGSSADKEGASGYNRAVGTSRRREARFTI